MTFPGLVTNHLLRNMSYRVVAVFGGLLFTLGMFLTVFAHSMVHIVFTYSIIAGEFNIKVSTGYITNKEELLSNLTESLVHRD
jgi:hypothetical protein